MRTVFIRTSKSIGKLMPKKSASVKISRAKPDHFFEIWPISLPLKSTICHHVKRREGSNIQILQMITYDFGSLIPWKWCQHSMRKCSMDLQSVIQFHRSGFWFYSSDTNTSIPLRHVQWLDQEVMQLQLIVSNRENNILYKPTDDRNGWFHCCTDPILSYRMACKSHSSFECNNHFLQQLNTP